MTQPKGDKAGGRSAGSAKRSAEEAERAALIPDLFRRALALGLSGIFTTEAAFRQALGDTLPRDWVDFAVDQSDRTRTEFVNRLATELAAVVENVDLDEFARQMLKDHRIEVKAEIKLVAEDAKGGKSARTRVSVVGGGKAK